MSTALLVYLWIMLVLNGMNAVGYAIVTATGHRQPGAGVVGMFWHTLLCGFAIYLLNTGCGG